MGWSGPRVGTLFSVCCFAMACATFSEAPDDAGASPGADGGEPADAPSIVETGVDAPGGDPAEPFLTFATGFSDLRDVAADEQRFYVSEQSPGGVHALPLPSITLPSTKIVAGAPTGLALGGATLFWFDNKYTQLYAWDESSSPTKGNVEPRPLTSLATVGSYLVSVIKRSGSQSGVVQLRSQDSLNTVSRSFDTNSPFDVAVNGADIFWTDVDGIRHVSIDNTNPPDQYAPCPNGDCEYIAADNSGVYWTSTLANAVTGKLADKSIVPLGGVETAPTAIASDSSGVYWITGDGRVRRWTSSDRNTVDVSSGFPVLNDLNARSLALTSKYVIWLSGDGRVLAHAK